MNRIHGLRFLSGILALVLMGGCGGKPGAANGTETAFSVPDFQDASFHGEQAEDYGEIQVDFSMLELGNIGVEAESNSRLKFQIVCGEEKYNYDLPGDGTAEIVPLNMGNGSYTFRLMEEAGESKYACTWTETREVQMKDEFQPYLRPSQMVNYGEQSQCVQQAKSLVAQAASDVDAAGAIYDYLTKNIQYDNEKAASVKSGYLPDPDETLKSGKGICLDYASLAAAMMRSVGIPCKLITGYVGDDQIYHAWNCVYLQNQGWISVEIKADANTWNRIDTTFAAGGMPAGQITDDSEYTTRYTY